MYRAGRGAGKTRAIAEAFAEMMLQTPGDYAVVAKNDKAVREVNMFASDGIEGALLRRGAKYSLDKRDIILRLPNGSQCFGFNSQKPDNMRGKNCAAVWLDELAFHQHPKEMWNQAALATRKGDAKILISSTPSRLCVPLFREIENRRKTHVRRTSTLANFAQLSPSYRDRIMAMQGTRDFRTEVLAELDEAAGLLFDARFFQRDAQRPRNGVKKRVLALDPAMGGDGEDLAESGIIIASSMVVKDAAGNTVTRAFLEADRSGRYTPEKCIETALEAYHELNCDAIIIESNQGGEWLRSAFKQRDPKAKVELVSAQVDKARRAFVIASHYERGHVWHCSEEDWERLELQMLNFDPATIGRRRKSPDRVDAAVYALANLFGQSLNRSQMHQIPLFF